MKDKISDIRSAYFLLSATLFSVSLCRSICERILAFFPVLRLHVLDRSVHVSIKHQVCLVSNMKNHSSSQDEVYVTI